MNDSKTQTGNTQIRSILITASLLMTFAMAGAVLVGITFIQTEDDIEYNEKLTLLKKLNNIIPSGSYDNDLLHDAIVVEANSQLGTDEDTIAYRARKEDKDVAVVLSSVAPNGYNGSIHMLVGIYADGKVAGVRVVKHKETPGLGDAVSMTHSDWILSFENRSLSDPDEKGWKVKRDGGVFDQFTGATITPRAVVKAVHNALLYFDDHQATLFSKTGTDGKSNSKGQDSKVPDSKQAE